MTDQTTVTNAVAKRDNSPTALIQQYRADFATVLPSHHRPDTWVRLAQGALRRDRKLAAVAQRNPASLMAALLECARLGHEPATENFYLVPFGAEVQGIEGYRGVVERIYRAGAVSTVKAEIVRANDIFDYEPSMARPDHKVDWFGDRGPIIGAYAYAEMVDGATSRVVVINQDYIAKVKRESQGSDKATSPWQKWEEAMVLKTAAHRLEPWVPTSNEYMRERLRLTAEAREAHAQPIITGPAPSQPVDVETGEVLDGELVCDADVFDNPGYEPAVEDQ